ncbi:MAG: bile acid:sodium symporter [Thermoplasmatales archaeon]|nr:bile acid:sodium symporter [Candidatus Thermoplasmatota archaeon]MDA8055695.1 bile acid:sodium symporter [Thermoplasmatales archaeon]
MSNKSRLMIIRDHLDKFLAIYVVIAIVIGLLAGYFDFRWIAANKDLIKDLQLVAIIIMIFPMMVMMNFRGLGTALKNWKLLTIVLLMNFGWGPIMAILLGDAFVSSPLVRLGLFLAWLVPCSSMSVGYVGLMRGNIEASTAMVTVTFLIAIPIIPIFASLYGAAYHVQVSVMLLVVTIIEIIIVPLLVGIPTHEILVKRLGKDRFKAVTPLFPTVTMLGMFMIIFVIFFGESRMIITNLHAVFGVFYSALVFGTVSLVFLTLLFKVLKFDYWDSMAGLFPSIGKNEGTAIAIAATAFSPLVAIAPATLPVFQVIFLITYIKLRPRIAHFFGIKGKDVTFKEDMLELSTGNGGGK